MFPLLKTCLHFISLLFIFRGKKSNELIEMVMIYMKYNVSTS